MDKNKPYLLLQGPVPNYADTNYTYSIDQQVIDNDLMEQSLELEQWAQALEDDGPDNFNIEQEV